MSSRKRKNLSRITKKPKLLKSTSSQEMCWLLYNTIRSKKGNQGQLICEPFIRLPRKRNDQLYSLKITDSIDLQKIHQKIRSESYSSLEEMIDDLQLIISNMKQLYRSNTVEYKQTIEFWNLICNAKKNIEYSADTQSGEETDEQNDEDGNDVEDDNNSSNISHKEDISDNNDVTNEDDEEETKNDDESENGKRMKIPVLKLKVVSNETPALKEILTDGEDTRMSSFSEVDDHNDSISTLDEHNNVKRRGRKAKRDPSLNIIINEPSWLEELFSFVVTVTDENRSLSSAFKILPSHKKFPDYYTVIKDPIDLRMIARKLQANRYSNLEDLVKDFSQMINNAKTFNVPGSQIYKDACLLKRLLMNKKSDLETSKNSLMPVRSQRIRDKNVTTNANLSSVIAALDSESENDELASNKIIKTDNKINTNEFSNNSELQSFFNAVYNYKDSSNQSIIDPFVRLPSRRIYSDYYVEIKNPFSINKVQKKLETNQYSDLDSLFDEMNLVFNNAKQYNREDSKIFQDANILQQFMINKKKQLQESRNPTVKTEEDLTDQQVEKPKERKKRVSSVDNNVRKSLLRLYNAIMIYSDKGRNLSLAFKELPSKNDYPDYYNSIPYPIDLKIIDNKIKNDRFYTVPCLITDLKLVFSNARRFNEETSQIYKDAITLEKYLHEKAVEFGAKKQGVDEKLLESDGEPDDPETVTFIEKLKEFYNNIKNYADEEGRVLSIPFMKLPSKTEYPDYYDIVKKPFDMNKIWSKITSYSYGTPDDMISDIAIMFENACRYNEPDSVIYQDSLILERYALEQREAIFDDKDARTPPNIKLIVSEKLKELYLTTYNMKDSQGRVCRESIVNSFGNEILNSDDCMNFDIILQRINKTYYKRLDELQNDFFTVLMQIRHSSALESKVFEDTIEMQKFFIQLRHKLFHKLLVSLAHDYTEDDLEEEIDRLKNFKQREANEDMDESSHDDDGESQISLMQPGDMDQHEVNGITYLRGDFVYIEPRENGLAPHIVCIERLFRNETNEPWLHGCWLLRPNETIHLPTRTFLPKEVFKSDFSDSVPFDKVLGKCFVLGVKDYYKFTPEGFKDEDIYVCESRYSGRCKVFKKIKIWKDAVGCRVQLIPRQTGLQNKYTSLQRKSVAANNVSNMEAGCDYFEQIQTKALWVKLGDFIYLKTDAAKPTIVHVDKIWKTKNGKGFFTGTFYYYPNEVAHLPTHLFYNKEIFISSSEQTYPLEKITGLCYVLSSKEYCTCRPTHIPEADIYMCDSKYLDKVKMFKKCKPTRKVNISSQSLQDEWFYFSKPIYMSKVASHLLISGTAAKFPEKPKEIEVVVPAAITEEISFIVNNLDLDVTCGKGKPKRKKTYSITGYIIYASECRKDIQNEFPAYNFGDISREVGNRWKALPKITREKYEEKARILMASWMLNNQDKCPKPTALSSPIDSRSTTPPNAPSPKPIEVPTSKSTFVALPPRVQSIVHSETYLRYLERLTNGASTISNIKKGYSTDKPNDLTEKNLSGHWLANGPEHHGDVVNALWALRNHMLRDAFTISSL